MTKDQLPDCHNCAIRKGRSILTTFEAFFFTFAWTKQFANICKTVRPGEVHWDTHTTWACVARRSQKCLASLLCKVNANEYPRSVQRAYWFTTCWKHFLFFCMFRFALIVAPYFFLNNLDLKFEPSLGFISIFAGWRTIRSMKSHEH